MSKTIDFAKDVAFILLRNFTQIFMTHKCRLDEFFYCAALKNEIRQLKTPKMSDFVIVATLDKLIQPTYTSTYKL
mgnify:CR=1 FL=1